MEESPNRQAARILLDAYQATLGEYLLNDDAPDLPKELVDRLSDQVRAARDVVFMQEALHESDEHMGKAAKQLHLSRNGLYSRRDHCATKLGVSDARDFPFGSL